MADEYDSADAMLKDIRRKWVYSALQENKGVPFVERILNASKYPIRKNKDGSVSTHLMGYGEANNKFFVYPALQLKNGKWIESEDPTDALKSKNVIYFDKENQAKEFAKGAWKPFMK
jgi:hypothetical protein